jgi:hypothetical protein
MDVYDEFLIIISRKGTPEPLLAGGKTELPTDASGILFGRERLDVKPFCIICLKFLV